MGSAKPPSDLTQESYTDLIQFQVTTGVRRFGVTGRAPGTVWARE